MNQIQTTIPIAHSPFHIYEYDTERRRLWILGQRCHHGLTGSLLAVVGAALMAHDWKDHSMWFQLGHGNQP